MFQVRRVGWAERSESHRRLSVVLVVLFVLGIWRPALAGTPLYLQEPFDRITLNEQNDNALLVVRPLDLLDRRVPQNPPPNDTVKFRLLDSPQKLYELQWQHIAKVELFEMLLLAEARELVTKGLFGEAYEYYRVLQERYPKLPGLDAAYDECLMAEARQSHRQKRYDAALATLLALRDRDSKQADLPRALTLTVEKLVEKHVAADNYPAARHLLTQLAAWLPDEPLVAKYQGQFQTEAGRVLEEGKAALKAGKFRQADLAVRRVQRIWPQLRGAKDLAQQVHGKYPRAVIGVDSLASGADPTSLDNWAARRLGRLVARPLASYVQPGSLGGSYACPVGQIELDKSRRRIEIRLRNDVRWSVGDGVLTGFDAARALMAMTDPQGPRYFPGLADLLQGVQVYDVWRVELQLQRASPRPEAFLPAVLLPYTDPALLAEPGVGLGPYLAEDRTGDEASYLSNPRFVAKPGRPAELTERCFREPRQALAALGQGEIEAVDRVCPWDVGAAKALKHVSVHAYAIPTVHCLLPNLRRPLLSDRRFRRALVYALRREAMLARITAGQSLPGCKLTSGPFPAGEKSDDFGYACDESIVPRPYDPQLAVALIAEALQDRPGELGAASAEKERPGSPSLLLAHPAEPVARMACNLIRQQLELCGLQVTLKELPPEESARPVGDVDLVYAELLMWEPLTDARRLLGEDGLLGDCSPHLSLALRQLEQAEQWPQVRGALRQIHRLAHQEAAVIPLWQLSEFFAVHESLTGVRPAPVTMYDEVEQWRVSFHDPSQP